MFFTGKNDKVATLKYYHCKFYIVDDPKEHMLKSVFRKK